jgi:S1-C subfamily serine protease
VESTNAEHTDNQSISPFATPEPHRPANTHSNQTPKMRFLGMALVVLVSLSAGFIGGLLGRSNGAVTAANTSAQQKIVENESQLVSQIAKDVGQSVVSVDVTSQTDTSTSGGGFFDYYGGGGGQQQSAGTGIIIAANGLVVTNRHVVPQGTTKVSVTLADGTELNDVTVVGRTRDSDPLDVAFLKINDAKGKKLVAAKIGDSTKVVVGDKVVAIGNALGQFQNTVTSGIISGYGRTVQASDSSGGSAENLQDLFQTDAAINEGNSGGPLVNVAGEVIGINTAIAGNAQGIGFAIPASNISGLIKTVISTGKFAQPYLGVHYVSLTNDVAKQLNLSVTRGAYILPAEQAGGTEPIVPDSPADKAGLQGGDIIVAVDGTAIDEHHGLTSLLDQKSISDTVTLKIKRDGKDQDVKVTLEAAPEAVQ